MCLIRFGLTPAQRAELPIGVGTWLLPAWQALEHASAKGR